MKEKELYKTPNALAPHYGKFKVSERLLLTGHSHQAWPDCGFEAQTQAWLDAAEHVDDKWDLAFAMADRVRRGYAGLLDDPDGEYALGANTHELVTRWISALPLATRPRIITSDGEYHSIRRQLDRLAEEGIEIVKVSAEPAALVPERIIACVDDRTAAVMVSSVLFRNAHIVPDLGDVLKACQKNGAELLIDAYHQVNVVPFSIRSGHLGGSFVVGGGYKYCQLGEGNCFLRFPKDCDMRPVITGWFSEFSALAKMQPTGEIVYGDGAARFAGSTYDPTSHYRAAAVFDFFEEHDLTPEFLRKVSRHQVGLIAGLFDALDADPALVRRDASVDLERIAGFLALQTPKAEALYRALHDRGVLVDYRGDVLRLGPAPYLSDKQLAAAVDHLAVAIELVAAA